MEGNQLKELIFKRTGLHGTELVCPREQSAMTPCVARDGDICMLEDKTCVGCLENIPALLEIEKTKHTPQ